MQHVKAIVIFLIFQLFFFSACTKKSLKGVGPKTANDVPSAGSPFTNGKLIIQEDTSEVSVVIDVKVAQESLSTNLPAALVPLFNEGLALLKPNEEFAIRIKNPGVEVLKEWAKFPAIIGIANQVNGYRMLANDPAFPTQKAIQPPFLEFEKMAGEFETGLGAEKSVAVKVAIIDTGIDLKAGSDGVLTSPDVNLADDLTGTNMIEGEGEHANIPKDVHGHGTRMASLLAATRGNGIGIAGVASAGTKILPIKAFNAKGESSTTLLVNAIYRAMNMGADVVLIAASGETSGCDATLGHAISRAVDKGVVVVMSAGNSSRRAIDARRYAMDNLKYFSPGCWGPYTSGAITVGSTMAVNKSSEKPATFSNFGEGVEVYTPGTGMVSTGIGGAVQTGQGTSFSAALMAGIATHVVSYLKVKQWPELGGTARHLWPQYVETILRASAFRLANSLEDGEAFVLTLGNLYSFLTSWNDKSETDRLALLDNPRNKESWDTAQGGKYLAGTQHLVPQSVILTPGEKSTFKVYAVELESAKVVDATNIARCVSDQPWISMTDYGELSTSADTAQYPMESLNVAKVICRLEPSRWQSLQMEQIFVVGKDAPVVKSMSIQVRQVSKEYYLLKASYELKDLSPISVPASFSTSNAGFKTTLSPALFEGYSLTGGTTVSLSASYQGRNAQSDYVIPQEEIGEMEIQGYLGHTVILGQTAKFQAEIKSGGNNDGVQPLRAAWYVDGHGISSNANYVLYLNSLPLGKHLIEAKYISNLNGVSKEYRASYEVTVVNVQDGITSLSLIVEKAFANRVTQVAVVAEYESRALKTVTTETEFSVEPADGFVTVAPSGAIVVTSEAALVKTYTITGTYSGKSATASIKPTRLDITTGRLSNEIRLEVLGPDTMEFASYNMFNLKMTYAGGVKGINQSLVSWSTTAPNSSWMSTAYLQLGCKTPAGYTFQVDAFYEGIKASKEVRVPLLGPITGARLTSWHLGDKDQVSYGSGDVSNQLLYPALNIKNETSSGKPRYRPFDCISGKFKVDPPTGLSYTTSHDAEGKETLLAVKARESTPGIYTVTFDGSGYVGNGDNPNFQVVEKITILGDELVNFDLQGVKESVHSISLTPMGRFSSAPNTDKQLPQSDFQVTLLNPDRTPATGAVVGEHFIYFIVTSAKMVQARQAMRDEYILVATHKKSGMKKEFPLVMSGTNYFELPAPVATCPSIPAIPTPASNPACTPASEALSPVAAGDGTEQNPYLLCNISQVKEALETINWAKENRYDMTYFKLGKSIDLGGIENFEPIKVASYKWSLDGAGYTLSNLTMLNAEEDWMGFIRECRNSKIKNLNFVNPNIRGGSGVGTLCAGVYNSTIEDIQVKGGNVSAVTQVGGVFGNSSNSTFRRIFNSGTEVRVDTSSAGGLGSGFSDYDTFAQSHLIDSASAGSVIGLQASSAVGGLVGGVWLSQPQAFNEPKMISAPTDFSTPEKVEKNASILRSCWLGAGKRLEAPEGMVGGITGYNHNGVLFNVIADGGTSGATLTGSNNVGGVVGHNEGEYNYSRYGAVFNSRSNNLRLISSKAVGGFVGYAAQSIFQQNQSTSIRIEATNGDGVGGFVGTIFGDYRKGPARAIFRDSSATNSVYSTGTKTGGFVGYIDYTYANYPWLYELFDNNKWRQNVDPNYQLPDVGNYTNWRTIQTNLNYIDSGVKLW